MDCKKKNENTPIVSVIMPVYNGQAYVRAAIDSVIKQKFPNWELIVVDDGSTDGTFEVVRQIARTEPRIKLFRQKNSGGPASPKNQGIKKARGEFICFIDQDDLYNVEKLGTEVEILLENPECDVIFGDMLVFNDGQRPETGFRYLGPEWIKRAADFLERKENNVYCCTNDFYSFMSSEVTSVTTQTVMIRRKVLMEQEGPFDETLRVSDDIDLWFRLAKKYCLFYIDKILAYYRRHKHAVTSSKVATHEGFIKAHTKNLQRATGTLNAKILRKMRFRIASEWFHLGYIYWINGQAAKARSCFRMAFIMQPSMKTASAWIKSWFPSSLRKVLKTYNSV